ncbi:MAG: hypothetical protein MUE81_15830, partial [Thermoflexibacter sp.]|nr:hypothetical protein [Thermoflexibacter sp.]
QGKVLEELMKLVLRNYIGCEVVPDKIKERKEILTKAFGKEIEKKGDIDAFAMKKDKIIAIQIRSRDDTGGTTAKASLVSYLREMLRLKKDSKYKILYLVSIWDSRDSQQKQSTINEMYSALKETIESSISADEFLKNVATKGVDVGRNITLRMTYGTDEMIDSVCDWFRLDKQKGKKNFNNLLNQIENWDDLWITYAVANLELSLNKIQNISNIAILDKILEDNEGFSFDWSSYKGLVDSIDKMVNKIVFLWKGNTLPLQSLGDKALYVRDLLLLKACYIKLTTSKSKMSNQKSLK